MDPQSKDLAWKQLESLNLDTIEDDDEEGGEHPVFDVSFYFSPKLIKKRGQADGETAFSGFRAGAEIPYRLVCQLV